MRIKKGIVTSTKQQKTLVVTVHTYKNHPKYKKKYRVSKKFHVHNPEEIKFKEGDEITFRETRPISKLKKWILEPEEDKQEKQEQEII